MVAAAVFSVTCSDITAWTSFLSNSEVMADMTTSKSQEEDLTVHIEVTKDRNVLEEVVDYMEEG